MKDYKWAKFAVMIVMWGCVGAAAGAGMTWLMESGSQDAIKQVFYQYTPYLFWVALVCGVIGLIGYFHFNRLLKKDGYSNDEGSYFDRYENRISAIMTFSTVCAIVNFVALGLNLHTTEQVGFELFLVNVVLAFAGEVANIALMKKVRPELNADPTDAGFRKHYFEKLDECEKIQTGRASFKTISIMIPAYVATLMLCYVLIITLEVSPIICLPVGILWLLQTVTMVYHSCRGNINK